MSSQIRWVYNSILDSYIREGTISVYVSSYDELFSVLTLHQKYFPRKKSDYLLTYVINDADYCCIIVDGDQLADFDTLHKQGGGYISFPLSRDNLYRYQIDEIAQSDTVVDIDDLETLLKVSST